MKDIPQQNVAMALRVMKFPNPQVYKLSTTDATYSVLLVHSDILQNHSQPHQDINSSPIPPDFYPKMVPDLLLHPDFPGGYLRTSIIVLFVSLPVPSSPKSLLQNPPGSLHRCGQNMASKCRLFDCERYLYSSTSHARDRIVTHVQKT